MTYTGRCPHCGVAVRGGHGVPIKRIGTPIRTCHTCHRPYIDDNMYEWAILDGIHKFHFYFFANNRWLPYFLFLIFAAGGYWLVTILGCTLWAASCFAWVNLTRKDAFELSHNRCLQAGYIESLSVGYYDKLSEKKCEQYKREIEQRQAEKARREKEKEDAERAALLREYHQRCKKCGHKLSAVEMICSHCGERR